MLTTAAYTHAPKQCVIGHNIVRLRSKTVAQCKKLCSDAGSTCVAFEYGVAYGGKGLSSTATGDCSDVDGTCHRTEQDPYAPGDCILQSSIDRKDCDGSFYNLDLYIKGGSAYDADGSGKIDTSELWDWIDSLVVSPPQTSLEVPAPQTSSLGKCVFPFKYTDDVSGVEKTYNSCTSVDDVTGKKWCSTKVDAEGQHIDGQGNWKHCLPPPATYTYAPKQCVIGNNIVRLPEQTASRCQRLCNDAGSSCVAFEFGVAYGGGGRSTSASGDCSATGGACRRGKEPYKPGDCVLQSSVDSADCDGSFYNLDLYIKNGRGRQQHADANRDGDVTQDEVRKWFQSINWEPDTTTNHGSTATSPTSPPSPPPASITQPVSPCSRNTNRPDNCACDVGFGDRQCGESSICHFVPQNGAAFCMSARAFQNTGPDTVCQFPFVFNKQTHYSCITDGDPESRLWCSTKTDASNNHIGGKGFYHRCKMPPPSPTLAPPPTPPAPTPYLPPPTPLPTAPQVITIECNWHWGGPQFLQCSQGSSGCWDNSRLCRQFCNGGYRNDGYRRPCFGINCNRWRPINDDCRYPEF